MNWDLKSDRPIYIQLVEHLQLAIISGLLPPGSRVPPVRELAAEAAVNPNTMQKALQELEQGGLVQTQRTSGRTVTQDTGRIAAVKAEFAGGEVSAFLEKMGRLGYAPQQAVASVSYTHLAHPDAAPPFCQAGQRTPAQKRAAA